MRLLITVALIACSAAHESPAAVARAAGATPETAARLSPQKRARKVRRRLPARRKTMPTTNKPAEPVLDGPNRMEIDPADIPPSERPRDPNVDDRTRIPSEVSPDDMAPAARKPKKRRP